MSYTCPVCGYPCLTERPRLPRSGGGWFEICPSCGSQFGLTDDTGCCERGQAMVELVGVLLVVALVVAAGSPPA